MEEIKNGAISVTLIVAWMLVSDGLVRVFRKPLIWTTESRV